MNTVFLNGKEISIEKENTLFDLLSLNGFSEKKGIAVALNNEVVTRSDWTNKQLKQGDKIIIIKATQGG